MIFLPFGGAASNVNVVPLRVKSLAFMNTPSTNTSMLSSLAGAWLNVKAVVEPLAVNVLTDSVDVPAPPTSPHASVYPSNLPRVELYRN